MWMMSAASQCHRSLACRHDCQRENPIDVIPSPAPPYLFLSAYGSANMARCSSMFASRHTTALAAVPHRPVGGRCSAGGAPNIHSATLHKARYRQNAAIAFAESHSKKFHVWNFPFPFFTNIPARVGAIFHRANHLPRPFCARLAS